MKKYFSFLALLIAGIFVMSCNLGFTKTVKNDQKGKVTINIVSGERTIVPVDWNLSEVTEWTITFTPKADADEAEESGSVEDDEYTEDDEYSEDDEYNEGVIDDYIDEGFIDDDYDERAAAEDSSAGVIVKTLENDKTSETYTLPVGNYTITVEGKGTHYLLDDDGNKVLNEECGEYNSILYTLKGSTSVTVTNDGDASPVIYVSLKKDSNGKDDDASTGFEYTLTFTDDAFVENEYLEDYDFNAYLTPVNFDSDSDNVALYCVMRGGPGTGSVEYTFTDTEYGSDAANELPSGYYYLTISYTYNNNTCIVPINDPLVEIVDNLKTTGSYTDADFAGVSIKNIYVTNEESSYNGLIPEHPKEFNSALQWLSDNQKDWTTANLYFKTKTDDAESAESYEEYVKALLPYYTNEYNPTSSDETDNGYNKEVNVYINGALNYVLKGGLVYITEDCVSNPSICFAGSSEHEESEGYVVYDDGVKVEELTLYQIAARVILNGVKDLAPCIKSIISPEMAKDYDPEDPDAYLMLEIHGVSYANDNISLAVLEEDGSGTSEGSYTVLTKEGQYLNCYTASAGQAGVTISKAIPEFEISGESTVYIENTAKTYSVVEAGKTTELGSDYTYEWFLNGNSAGTGSTYTLNSTTDSCIKNGSNTLMVVVGKDKDGDGTADEYASASLAVTVRETPFVGAIYNGKSLYSVDLTQDAYTGSVSRLTNVATSFTDFATDKNNYLYVAEVESSTAKIYQYEDVASVGNRQIYSRTIATGDTDLKLYYDSVNDNLYAAYMNTTDKKIYIEKYAALSKITFDGTVKPTEYPISDTALLTFDDFAVYDDGNGSVKLYIISKLSDDTYPKIYYSANLNTSPNSGTAIDLYSVKVDDESIVPTDENQIAAISITDITVNDGKVYALLSERNTAYSYGNFYSRGAVAEIDISKNNAVTLYGYNTDAYALNAIRYQYDSNSSSYNEYDATEYENKFFFGPSKFIAVTPKKLIISDDGAYCYMNARDLKPYIKNVNRVVTFDLATITSSVDIEATLDYTADYDSSGCDFNYIYFTAN